VIFVARDQSPEPLQPGKQLFDTPTSLVTSQLAPVLRLTAVLPVGRDQLDAVIALQSPVQRIRVIGPVADQACWEFIEKASGQGFLDEFCFVRRSAIDGDGQRKSPFAALGDGEAAQKVMLRKEASGPAISPDGKSMAFCGAASPMTATVQTLVSLRAPHRLTLDDPRQNPLDARKIRRQLLAARMLGRLPWRFCFRCAVSARAAPCASSISVTTDKAISVSAVVRAMAASICRAFWPCRSAAISTLESRISPMRAVQAVRDGSR
jgi:hypothetical protein